MYLMTTICSVDSAFQICYCDTTIKKSKEVYIAAYGFSATAEQSAGVSTNADNAEGKSRRFARDWHVRERDQNMQPPGSITATDTVERVLAQCSSRKTTTGLYQTLSWLRRTRIHRRGLSSSSHTKSMEKSEARKTPKKVQKDNKNRAKFPPMNCK